MEDTLGTDRASLGEWLRRERERRGLTLELIANRTKIAGSLLAGLESGDLSRWPTGIFRRAFVRAYAEAIGLDPDQVVAEFVVAHPEDGQGVVTVPRRLTSGTVRADALRLTLADAKRRAWRDGRRLGGAAIDAAVFGGVLGGLWTFAPGPVGLVLAWVVLSGYVAAGVVLTDTTPGRWLASLVATRYGPGRGFEDDRDADASVASDSTVVPFPHARRRRRQRTSTADDPKGLASGEGRARSN